MDMSLELRRKLCIAGIVIGVYLGFRYLVPVAVPFFIGWLLAVWIYPMGAWAERKIHLKKNWAAAPRGVSVDSMDVWQFAVAAAATGFSEYPKDFRLGVGSVGSVLSGCRADDRD